MELHFHATSAPHRALPLPLMLGHFLPWFTRRGADYPLPAEEAARLDWLPPIEDMRHWNDARAHYRRTHLRMPAIGVYDSRDPGVIEWQIHAAVAGGVDGFIVNWYGKYSVENVITLHWLRALEAWNARHPEQPFLYFICHDMQAQWPSEGKRPVSLEEDFLFIREHLIRDSYLCRCGRPLLAVFPYGDQRERYRQALDRVFGDVGADLIWAGGPPRRGEDAAFCWVQPDADTVQAGSPYPWIDPDNDGSGALAQFYAERTDSGGACRYLMGGVWPGFNDTLVRWAWNADADAARIRPRVMCRHTRAGSTLERTWNAYLDALRRARGDRGLLPAPLVQLITWNDYAEDTALEPTREDGDAPLQTCLRLKSLARELVAGRD
jgi:hypothetical protein